MDPTSIKEEPIESTNIKVENEDVDKSLPSIRCSMEINQEAIESTMTMDSENIYDTLLTIKEEFSNTPSARTLDEHEMDSTIHLSIKDEQTDNNTNIKVENENVGKSLPNMVSGTKIKQELKEQTMTVDCENIYDTILTIKEEFCNTQSARTLDEHEMDSTIHLSIKDEQTDSSTHIKVEKNVGKSFPNMVSGTEIKRELKEQTMTADCENIYDTILTIKEEFCNTPSNVTSDSNDIEGTLEAHKELGIKSNSQYNPDYSRAKISSLAVQTESSIPSLQIEVKSEDNIATVKGGSCENNQLTNIPKEKNNNVKNNISNNVKSGTLVKRSVKRKRNSNEYNKNKVDLETTVNFTMNQYKIYSDINSVIKRVNQDTTEDNFPTNHNEIESDINSVIKRENQDTTEDNFLINLNEIKSDIDTVIKRENQITTKDNFPTNHNEIKNNTVTNNETLNTPNLISIAIRPVINISDDILKTEYTCEISNLQSEDIVKVKTNNECTQLHNENKCSCSLCEIINGKSTNKGFICSVCNYRFRLKVQLIKHMKTHADEEDKPYSCHICPFTARSKYTINSHLRTHTGEKPYSCEICSFRTGQKCSLVRHIRVHKGEKHVQCNICHYKCTQKSTLREHMRTHTGEKPFSCYLCDFKCSFKQSLNVHLMNHKGHKPYSCDLCEFRCLQKSQLSTHMRRHTGEKPYACNVCGFRSARKGNIEKHKKVHLKKVILKKLCFNLS